MSIAINVVRATKLSVKCHDCAETKQIRALYSQLFHCSKSGNLRFKWPNFILSCLLKTLHFIDLPVGHAKLENNLPEFELCSMQLL